MIKNVLYKLRVGDTYLNDEGKPERAASETLCQVLNLEPGKIVVRPLYTNLLFTILNDRFVKDN